jgi:hypothetical protein
MLYNLPFNNRDKNCFDCLHVNLTLTKPNMKNLDNCFAMSNTFYLMLIHIFQEADVFSRKIDYNVTFQHD